MAGAAYRAALCPRVAYMPQGLGKNLYPDLSVQENIAFFSRLFGRRAPNGLGGSRSCWLPRGWRCLRELAIRPGAGVARANEAAALRVEQARRLADRYGRTLGPDVVPGERAAAPGGRVEPTFDVAARSSAKVPHRSDDEYHGGYNDYLWQLALADGNVPDVVLPGDTGRRDEAEHRAPAPRIIEASGMDDSGPAPD